MQLTQTVAPTQQPISLNEAKLFMHIIEDDEDTLIEDMIKTATEYCENFTNRQLEIATFELINERVWSDFKLPKNPIRTIEKIEYMDLEGNYQIMNTNEYYLYFDYGIGYIHFHNLPHHKQDKRAFKITFTSGYDVVPFSIKSYMKMAVSTLYENRENYVIGASINTSANPLLDKILAKYRILPI